MTLPEVQYKFTKKTIFAHAGRAGLRPNWAWCCCPEEGLFSFWHSRPTKKSRTPRFQRNHRLPI